MKYTYQTCSGTQGTIDADNNSEAHSKLHAKHGADVILIERDGIAVFGSKDPAGGAPARPAASANDPHGWCRAFDLAAARG